MMYDGRGYSRHAAGIFGSFVNISLARLHFSWRRLGRDISALHFDVLEPEAAVESPEVRPCAGGIGSAG